MSGQGFDINVTSNEVTVKQDGSMQNGSSRGTAGAITILGALFFLARLFLLMVRTLLGKHDAFTQQNLIRNASRASGFELFALMLEGVLAIGIACMFVTGIRLFFPAGEELHCDRTALIYRKIPWISFKSRWKEWSFPIGSVSEMTYGVIHEGDPEKNTRDIYGLDFYGNNKQYKAFGGIKPSDANNVLKQLRAFGVDVIINQDIQAMIENENRAGDTSWMDRSWMDNSSSSSSRNNG